MMGISSNHDSVPSMTGRPRGSVLHVDDEEQLLSMLTRFLQRAGFQVTTASDGRRAVELLDRETFDVVVSDIDMPRMSGLQFLGTVRQRDLDLPVVLMTGMPDLKSAVRAVELGALNYLIKPVDTAQLEKIVTRAARLNAMARIKREALTLVNDGGIGVGGRIAVETAFERALSTLWVAYQPIVHAREKSLFGFEALLRSEEVALPHPGAVLDAAERLGRVHDLGQAVRAPRVRSHRHGPAEERPLRQPSRARSAGRFSCSRRRRPSPRSRMRVVLEITERASLDEEGEGHARGKVRVSPGDGLSHRDRRSGRRLRQPHELHGASSRSSGEARHVSHP